MDENRIFILLVIQIWLPHLSLNHLHLDLILIFIKNKLSFFPFNFDAIWTGFAPS